jgi:hypothetical protein
MQPVMQGDLRILDPTMIAASTYVAFYTGPEGDVAQGAQLEASTGRFIGPGGQEPFAGLGGHMLVYRYYYDGKDLGVPKLKVPPIRWSADGWQSLNRLPDGWREVPPR